jgi:hypothetical protein
LSIQILKNPHLEENDILQAVIDTADLPMEQQKHLVDCPRCRSQKERLEHELAHLGHLAERYAPEQKRHVRLPSQKKRSPIFSRRFVVSAAAVAAVFLVVWGTFLIRSQQQGSVGNLAKDMVEAERLMTEINGLVENALPQVYLDIVGETDSNLDDDFIDFLIPSNESAPQIAA